MENESKAPYADQIYSYTLQKDKDYVELVLNNPQLPLRIRHLIHFFYFHTK